MNKIVETGLKIDLHIHSCASSKKDGKKVKNNTIENLPVLVERLVEQEVNICSVTDHDTFLYEIYSELKKEELNDNSIKKVLPGVEFSVPAGLPALVKKNSIPCADYWIPLFSKTGRQMPAGLPAQRKSLTVPHRKASAVFSVLFRSVSGGR